MTKRVEDKLKRKLESRVQQAFEGFGGVETWFHSPPESGGVPLAKQRRGGLFKDEQYRLIRSASRALMKRCEPPASRRLTPEFLVNRYCSSLNRRYKKGRPQCGWLSREKKTT